MVNVHFRHISQGFTTVSLVAPSPEVTKRINAEPQFFLVTSPVHSGQSTLVMEVLDQVKTEKPSRPILKIDM